MSLERRIKRLKRQAIMKEQRKLGPEGITGIHVANESDPDFAAFIYVALSQRQGKEIGEVGLDLSAWRPGKQAHFWRSVEMFRDMDCASVKDEDRQRIIANRKAGGSSQAAVSKPDTLNLRI